VATRKIHIGTYVTLVTSIAALMAGILEAGVGGLLTIPLVLIALFGSLLGLVPFIGPLLYYYAIGYLFGIIQEGAHVSMPIASLIIFYTHFVFSIVYFFITSTVTILYLLAKRKKR